MTSLYEMEMESITGEMVPFSDYRDQALLIVNLASQ
jgi:glutathione peroxidase-family protein